MVKNWAVFRFRLTPFAALFSASISWCFTNTLSLNTRLRTLPRREKNLSCDVSIEDATHTLRFANERQQTQFTDRMHAAAKWRHVDSREPFKFHPDTVVYLFIGISVAALVASCFWGDWENFDDSQMQIASSRKHGRVSIHPDFCWTLW